MNTDNPIYFSISRWIAYHVAGWIAGIVLIMTLGGLFEWAQYKGQAVIGVGMGLGIGAAQWYFLRNKFSWGYNWIIYNVVGLFASYLFFDYFSRHFNLSPDVYTILATSVGGLLTGVLQYHFIFKKKYARSAKWVLYCFMGWTLAHLLTFGYFSLPLHLPGWIQIPLAFIMIVAGAPILGWITGIGLRKIFR